MASCGRATRTSRSATDRPIATSTPYRMSKASTPAKVATAIRSSARRKTSSRRNAVTSISWTAANTTIPPSAAVGILARTECANSSTASTAAATASEYALVLFPTVTAMAVLVPLLLTGKPRTSAEPALATPSASSSRFATICSPRRANERAVTTSSLKPTNSTVNAGSSSSRSTCGWRTGKSTVGRRAGTGPTTPTPPGRRAATATVASSTASSGPGMRGQRQCRSRRNPRTDSETARTVGWMWLSPRANEPTWAKNIWPVTGTPVTCPSWSPIMIRATPAM